MNPLRTTCSVTAKKFWQAINNPLPRRIRRASSTIAKSATSKEDPQCQIHNAERDHKNIFSRKQAQVIEGQRYGTAEQINFHNKISEKASTGNHKVCTVADKLKPSSKSMEGSTYSGRGTFRLPSGVTFHGMFENGLFEGHGKRTNADGSTLEGTWKAGIIHNGNGTLHIDNGKIISLVGEFRNGRLYNGKGCFWCPNGGVLQRQWVEGIEKGTITCILPTGDVYEGQMQHYKMHGTGKLTYTDGKTLEGQFVNGKIHNGQGEIRDESSGVQVITAGRWVEGVLQRPQQ